MPHESASNSLRDIIEFADAPNGDVWLAARDDDGLYVDVRRAARCDVVAVARELRGILNGELTRDEVRARLSVLH